MPRTPREGHPAFKVHGWSLCKWNPVGTRQHAGGPDSGVFPGDGRLLLAWAPMTRSSADAWEPVSSSSRLGLSQASAPGRFPRQEGEAIPTPMEHPAHPASQALSQDNHYRKDSKLSS